MLAQTTLSVVLRDYKDNRLCIAVQYKVLIMTVLLTNNAEGEAAVTMTDSTFSWDSEDSEDSEKATLKK